MKKLTTLFGVKIKKNKLLFGISITLIALAAVLIIVNLPKSNPSITGIILFEGKDCDQCAKVDTFITNNKVQDKVPFTTLEVFNDSGNADLLKRKAHICGLDISQIGVPFLWDGAHCFLGYIDVIDFFQKEIAQKP